MAIYRIFEGAAFQPEETKRMGEAYELALKAFKQVDRHDPFTETIARQIIETAQTGEKDPVRICSLAIQRIHNL